VEQEILLQTAIRFLPSVEMTKAQFVQSTAPKYLSKKLSAIAQLTKLIFKFNLNGGVLDIVLFEYLAYLLFKADNFF